MLRGVRYLDSQETPSYIAGIDDWLQGLAGLDLSQGPLALGQVDGLSGATVTSRAVLATVNARRPAGDRDRLRPGRPAGAARRSGPRGPTGGFMQPLALLLLFFPVYLSGSERLRLAFQVASLAVLGLWLNTLVTEVDLVNLSQGQTASPTENPGRWLLLGFVALTSLLFGQVWCGYLCPFGALQELVSRLGRRLGLRSYPDRPLEQRMRLSQVPAARRPAGPGLDHRRGDLGNLRPHAARLRRPDLEMALGLDGGADAPWFWSRRSSMSASGADISAPWVPSSPWATSWPWPSAWPPGVGSSTATWGSRASSTWTASAATAA